MSLETQFAQLRKDFFRNPLPGVNQRKASLKALRQQLLSMQAELYQAAATDFGQRSASETRLLEVLPSINSIDYSLRRVKGWMKPQKRHVSPLFWPASNQVEYQPLGVVGIIVPWNYPIFLALGPLVAAISAGNKVMLKLSEFTPAINQVLKQLIEKALPDCALVIEGEADVAAAFSKLPFDHLLFTGSTAVGRHVMQAAAQNLTPVTLELGGKSPVLFGPDLHLNDYADRIIFGKCANGGQTCVAPDYLLVPAGKEQRAAEKLKAHYQQMFPQGRLSQDWTSVINPRQWQRLQQGLQQAAAAGAQVISCGDAVDVSDPLRRMDLHLVLGAPLDCELWQQEIFGPVLPIYGYRSTKEAIEFVQARPRPLAFYLFSNDKELQQRCREQIHAGGLCINDTLVHVGQDDLPFGGVGPSGMGHYHGKEGFLTFSHAKAVHRKGRFSSGIFGYPHMRSRLLDKVLDLWLGYRITDANRPDDTRQALHQREGN
ncbi:coniferyl aldehyde dehydrogenase [Rheinheimera texasensis]|uniref:coniferyl aldehyde dehydrogenase n=1 Tax=Rheinheimera texasensis TaxID=306205 RepID=UPI000A011135|nr:coniferyl aldehyde dehydrogenase [Rheinheimera texasensis]